MPDPQRAAMDDILRRGRRITDEEAMGTGAGQDLPWKKPLDDFQQWMNDRTEGGYSNMDLPNAVLNQIPRTTNDAYQAMLPPVIKPGAKAIEKEAEFLSPRAAALVEERIAALRAVRESKTPDSRILGAGYSAVTKRAGFGDVVKTPVQDVEINKTKEEFKRRAFLKSILEKEGLAPRTMLVETSKNKYLVQPEADSIPKYINDDLADGMRDRLRDAGLTTNDVWSQNVGKFGDEYKFIDAGQEGLKRAMTPEERKSALEKFISYGKRKKPWLDE